MALVRQRDPVGIEVTMKGHAEARNVNELWAGQTNIKERRKLQNRSNRRAYRKRQAQQNLLPRQEVEKAGQVLQPCQRTRGPKLPGLHVFALKPQRDRDSRCPISLNSFVKASAATDQVRRDSTPDSGGQDATPLKLVQSWRRNFEERVLQARLDQVELISCCGLDPGSTDSDSVVLEEYLIRALNIRSRYPLPADHLLNLMYYNVFRGLSRNIRSLNLELNHMASSHYPSPFIAGRIDTSTMAPDFHPTIVQRTIPHHPCFDIFPDSVLRDNAIMQWGLTFPEFEARLCMILAGRYTWHEIDIPLRHGCVLWGEPDAVESWEVTEGFAKDWPFLVAGAFRLEAATNRWRRLRGEPPISFASGY
ncbi:uncharacterized protein Z518_06830 [Rhinocladiella mackenziei CBS 650.93]|uniref:Rhinocladiella mackenziei CBS 650.93 unplaced genomic scaffold supercont1.5, whole genome shotgun sequence n=1 Tax=Rhinocladiella mackenziei CBS 650.93 TaxID=1442369 RepID=A0A0D2GYJ7_9EURO|nr:uncharacterized protein Z518_06830 [Rhinocladiella mackenziei CBS 650.93]KIX03278.1 hypothetical protein Z518_06830 [Rhinocladiella mackenziei CBS 650.93]